MAARSRADVSIGKNGRRSSRMKQYHQQLSGFHVSPSTQPYERCCERPAILQGCDLTVILTCTANRDAKPRLAYGQR